VDLFSGCGGTSEGFLAVDGVKHLYAADLDPWANRTYARNLGATPEQIDLGELAESSEAKRWAKALRGETDGLILVGCAPCQGFSSHAKTRGDHRKLNPLLGAVGKLVVRLQPEAVFIENVPDLFANRNWESFERLRDTLQEDGYDVKAAVVNFAELGVPQERFRAVILARKGDRATFPAPSHSPAEFSTVRDAIGQLPAVRSGETHEDDPMHHASLHRGSTLEIIRQVPQDGGSRPRGVGPQCLDRARGSFGGYTDVYGRLAWDEPAPTITARCRTPSCGRFVHPEQDRGLTAREAGLLQTFPDDWSFEGPFDDRYKQIGNAVPPLAANAFARHIAAGWPASSEEVGTLHIADEPLGQSFSVQIPGIRRRRLAAVA
jgi:DNA (cytosine-5)-methyltransferase 1